MLGSARSQASGPQPGTGDQALNVRSEIRGSTYERDDLQQRRLGLIADQVEAAIEELAAEQAAGVERAAEDRRRALEAQQEADAEAAGREAALREALLAAEARERELREKVREEQLARKRKRGEAVEAEATILEQDEGCGGCIISSSSSSEVAGGK